jgi:YcxB-like protein
MDASVIAGSARLGVGDLIRARWNRVTVFVLAGALAFLVAYDIWATRPEWAPTPDALRTWEPLGWSVSAVLALWFAAVLAVGTLYGLRLSVEQRTLTYALDAEAIRAHDATGTGSAIAWSVVRRVSEGAWAFRLYLRPIRVLYLPKRAFAAQDLDVLRALFRDKLGMRAKLNES